MSFLIEANIYKNCIVLYGPNIPSVFHWLDWTDVGMHLLSQCFGVRQVRIKQGYVQALFLVFLVLVPGAMKKADIFAVFTVLIWGQNVSQMCTCQLFENNT